jgi:signal transduction histidine kinase
MRTLLRELRPHTIADTDLVTLVTHLGQGLEARHDMPVEVRADITGTMPPEVHMALYRIVQEAMNNIAKHANASSVKVNLAGTESRADLSVADDGYGFDTADIAAGGSMGIDIMTERARDIGAELRISSELDIGTAVAVTWPSPTPNESA